MHASGGARSCEGGAGCRRRCRGVRADSGHPAGPGDHAVGRPTRRDRGRGDLHSPGVLEGRQADHRGASVDGGRDRNYGEDRASRGRPTPGDPPAGRRGRLHPRRELRPARRRSGLCSPEDATHRGGRAPPAVLLSTVAHGMVDIYWVRGTPVLGWLLVGMACGVYALRRTPGATSVTRAGDTWSWSLTGAEERSTVRSQRSTAPSRSPSSTTRARRRCGRRRPSRRRVRRCRSEPRLRARANLALRPRGEPPDARPAAQSGCRCWRLVTCETLVSFLHGPANERVAAVAPRLVGDDGREPAGRLAVPVAGSRLAGAVWPRARSGAADVRRRRGPAPPLGGAPGRRPVRRAVLPLCGGDRLAAARARRAAGHRRVCATLSPRTPAQGRAATRAAGVALSRGAGDLHPEVARPAGWALYRTAALLGALARAGRADGRAPGRAQLDGR